jgi:peptidoglycan/LPS O-acetylase OafA/YrhL
MQGFRFDTEQGRVFYSNGLREFRTRITDPEVGRRISLAFQVARGVTLCCLFLLLALGGNTTLVTALLALIVVLGFGLDAYIRKQLVNPSETGEPDKRLPWLPLLYLVGALTAVSVLRAVAPGYDPRGVVLVLLPLGLAIPLILLLRGQHGRPH